MRIRDIGRALRHNFSISMRFVVAVSLTAVIAACAYQGTRPAQLPLHGYQRVGIVPALYNPETDFDPFFARGPVSGAVKGAGVGAAFGMYIGIEATEDHARSGGPVGAALIGILLMPITVPVGAVVGLVAHTPEAEAEQIDVLIEKALQQDQFQLQFAKRIADHAVFFPNVEHEPIVNRGPKSEGVTPKYQTLYEEGFDVVMETAVEEIGFEGGSSKGKLRLFITAKIRIVDAKTNKLLITYDLSHHSPKRPFYAWIRYQGRPLADAIAEGLDDLASRVIYKSFGESPM